MVYDFTVAFLQTVFNNNLLCNETQALPQYYQEYQIEAAILCTVVCWMKCDLILSKLSYKYAANLVHDLLKAEGIFFYFSKTIIFLPIDYFNIQEEIWTYTL